MEARLTGSGRRTRWGSRPLRRTNSARPASSWAAGSASTTRWPSSDRRGSVLQCIGREIQSVNKSIPLESLTHSATVAAIVLEAALVRVPLGHRCQLVVPDLAQREGKATFQLRPTRVHENRTAHHHLHVGGRRLRSRRAAALLAGRHLRSQ